MNIVSNEYQSDEILVQSAKTGDETALTFLIKRFTPHVRNRAKWFVRYGLDIDDLFQEGMIAFLKAVRCYQKQCTSSFKTFAFTCVNNKMLSIVKAHKRNKNAPMRNYLPFSEMEDSLEHQAFGSKMQVDPQNLLIEREEIATHNQHINTLLSTFEQQVFQLYLGSYSYDEMSEKLGSSTKAVDNALQRVRRKLRTSLKIDKGCLHNVL